VHQAQVSAAIGTPEFAPGLSAEVNVMLRDGLQEARLQLNPAEMGPITVQIQIEGSHARISLSAEQAPTRDALEQALPTLASTLRDNGLTLTGGGVFEQPRPPRDDNPPPNGAGPGSGDDLRTPRMAGVTDASGGARRLAPRGVVDLYA
jgi:flagellar hook-length control protein FliK